MLGSAALALIFLVLPAAARTNPLTVEDPPVGAEEIVFAVRQPGQERHYYANFGSIAFDPERKLYGQGGKLCRLNLGTGQLTVLLDDPRGGVRDPQVSYDGKKILFSYRRGGTPNYLLYEIQADGSDPRRLTDGPWDDIEPTYLPNGRIVFCSSRCRRWVNCWPTPVAVLHTCDGDGKNIRIVSSNNQHDNTPWVLADGRILYTRWEYVDRSEVSFHHLWTANPDGTGQMVFFGNMHPGTAMLDAKPIPGTRRVVASFSPEHGRCEHTGYVTIVDPGAGPDAASSARRVSRTADFRDPYPLAEDSFLVAQGSSLLVMNGEGATRVLYTLPEPERAAGLECHEPRPLRPRPREALLPDRIAPAQATGVLLLSDVYRGRNMGGVRRGEIKELLVLETLPKPINFTGSGDPISYNGTFTLERVLGTVPVEADGSAFFELPALRSFFFVALDGQGMAVKRMQSFLTVQPGEMLGCVGCHEHRTETPRNVSGNAQPTAGLLALRRPPSAVRPIPDVPEVFDFPRDIQPILNRRCVSCHDYDRRDPAHGPRAGGVSLAGDRGPLFSHSFWMLTVRGEFSDGRNLPRGNYAPRTLGSAASPLLKRLDGSHYGVKLTPREKSTMRLWIEAGAPYAGTYAALGTGMIGAYREDIPDRSDTQWPAIKAAQSVLERRCGACHTKSRRLPSSPSDDLGMPPWKSKFADPRTRLSRHILYNLTRPEKSLLLLAPLAKAAGGYGVCAGRGNAATGIFAGPQDPDYRVLFESILATARALEGMKRFDMADFHPGPEYIREMERYAILPRSPAGPIDIHAADRAYWESLWYRPSGQ